MDARIAPSGENPIVAQASALGGLAPDAAARALAAACDVALVIDADGVIRDVALGSDDLADQGIDGWVGRAWSDTVHAENSPKIRDLLSGSSEPGRWRQVNHKAPMGDLPIRYLALPADQEGRVIAIGRDMRAAAAVQQRLLRAQQAMERDSLRLRQLEARYRLLFDTAFEPIIVIDATRHRTVEANPAARRLAQLPNGFEGNDFLSLVHPDDRAVCLTILGAAVAADHATPATIRLSNETSFQLTAKLFRQDRSAYLLVRLQPVEAGVGVVIDRPLAEVLERMPDAFVLTDASLSILACNGAFLDLVRLARSGDVRGQPLNRFLGRPGIDLGILEAQLREHGAVRNFATIVRAGKDLEDDVEISGVTSHEGGELRHGFSIRAVSRRLAPTTEHRQVPRSVEQLTELVGHVSLKEIVRESTDLIERLCIEAALNHTADNRASAAEVLGLSRQSLYSKLHRHGLGNLSDNS
jgi:transcriptional regulator PpsR